MHHGEPDGIGDEGNEHHDELGGVDDDGSVHHDEQDDPAEEVTDDGAAADSEAWGAWIVTDSDASIRHDGGLQRGNECLLTAVGQARALEGEQRDWHSSSSSSSLSAVWRPSLRHSSWRPSSGDNGSMARQKSRHSVGRHGLACQEATVTECSVAESTAPPDDGWDSWRSSRRW